MYRCHLPVCRMAFVWWCNSHGGFIRSGTHPSKSSVRSSTTSAPFNLLPKHLILRTVAGTAALKANNSNMFVCDEHSALERLYHGCYLGPSASDHCARSSSKARIRSMLVGSRIRSKWKRPLVALRSNFVGRAATLEICSASSCSSRNY